MDADQHLDSQLELARQPLPLGTWREVPRDGLLCIDGIQGIAAGAVLWRADDGGALQLLSHFGLGAGRLRVRYRMSAAAQAYLLEAGPLTLDGARRRPAGRTLLRALRPLDAQLGDAWLLPLHAEGRLRGVLCAGPSLVTQELAAPNAVGSLVDLAELLRLRLLGCGPEPKIGKVDAPILMLHGELDRTVPVDVGRQLRDAAPPGTRWVEIPGGSHSRLHSYAAQTYRQEMRGLIAQIQSRAVAACGKSGNSQ